jgi:hypothetical protein
MQATRRAVIYYTMIEQQDHIMNVKPSRNIVLKYLQGGIVKLQFTKEDGTLREMNATLLSSKIPAEYIPENRVNPSRPPDPDLVKCFDLDQKGWRSFKISRLTQFEPVRGNKR